MERRPGRFTRSRRGGPTPFTSAVLANTKVEVAGPDHGRGRTETDGNLQCLRRTETIATALERALRADDERQPNDFNGDVATGFRRQGAQIRCYKEFLKASPKRLQITSAYWKELARDRPTWRRRVKTGAAIYEDNRTTAARAIARLTNLNFTHLATPQCQQMFWALVCPTGRLRINCGTRTTTADVSLSTPVSSSTSKINPNRAPDLPSPSSTASISAAVTLAPNCAHNPDAPSNINLTTANTSNVDSAHACLHCDCTFTSHIGHLRIYRTETGEPVPEEPTYSHRIPLN
ncbi:hypothetical protein SprV_0200835100 [Sparganum proliferum]